MGTGDRIALPMGDRITPPMGDRITPPTGDRSHLGTFHVRFAVGKRLTVNVFRQRINRLFQGVEDIWRGIAKRSPREIALGDYPLGPSQGKNLNMGTGDRIQCSPDSFSREKFEHGDVRSRSTPFGRSLLVIIPRFLLKGKF
ncbi:hypothetical protein [Cylindrospermopsis raciborskii]|nr:hypothetical protein [Cylindrospermopsis raciborskii]